MQTNNKIHFHIQAQERFGTNKDISPDGPTHRHAKFDKITVKNLSFETE
jgi:hypothetical protein